MPVNLEAQKMQEAAHESDRRELTPTKKAAAEMVDQLGVSTGTRKDASHNNDALLKTPELHKAVEMVQKPMAKKTADVVDEKPKAFPADTEAGDSDRSVKADKVAERHVTGEPGLDVGARRTDHVKDLREENQRAFTESKRSR
jgi:hypothetical protein